MLSVVAAVLLMRGFQRDFLPDVDEGSVLYMPTTLPGLPTREAGWIVQQMDRKLKAIPEVERVFAKLGRADTSTDPAPVSMIETTIMLKPKSAWRPGMTRDRLVAEMDKAMQIVGYVNTWVQPIRARVMMQTTGIQTPVGVKVKGPAVAEIERISQQVEQALRDVPGTKYVLAERISEGYYTDVQYQLAQLAAHGVTADEAMLTVRYGIGGDNLVGIRQADNTVVPLAVQYSAEYLDTLDEANIIVVSGRGGFVAANMYVGARRNRRQLANNVVDKVIRNLFVDAERAETDLDAGVELWRAVVAVQLGVGCQRRVGVAGHIDLGDDHDIALLGVGHDIGVVGLGVVAALAATHLGAAAVFG